VKGMPWSSTPRLCARCGAELDPAAATVTVEDAASGEQRHLHQVCFDAAYVPAVTDTVPVDADPRRESA
jgi:hypothetical protein